MKNFVVIDVFSERHEAELVKGFLENQDIHAIISADDCGGLQHFLALGNGNIKLLVSEQDREKAINIIESIRNPKE